MASHFMSSCLDCGHKAYFYPTLLTARAAAGRGGKHATIIQPWRTASIGNSRGALLIFGVITTSTSACQHASFTLLSAHELAYLFRSKAVLQFDLSAAVRQSEGSAFWAIQQVPPTPIFRI